LGFISSTFPDLLKIWRDAADKKHEITLLKMQMEFQAQGRQDRLEEISLQTDITERHVLYKTFYTGIKEIDALNGSVRPIIAYAFFILYASLKFISFTALPEINAPFVIIYETLWTEEDAAIFAGIISFYFGQRTMNKVRGSG